MEHFLHLDTLTYRLLDPELFYMRLALSILTVLACNYFGININYLVISNTFRYHFKLQWKKKEVLEQHIEQQMMGSLGNHSQFQRHSFMKEYHLKKFYHSPYYYVELFLLGLHPSSYIEYTFSVTCINFSNHS